MGVYLSSPSCEKDTIQGSNDRLAFAASSMQGWRISQEDAHNAILDYDDKTSFFAVYDGHGGAEIALYCSRYLPDFLKQLNSYREGRLNEALTESFLKFDSLLLDRNVKEILRELAESKGRNSNDEEEEEGGHDDDDDDDDDDGVRNSNQSHELVIPTNTNEENHHNDELNVEEAQLLRKEAELPIEELLKRYGEDSKHAQSAVPIQQATKPSSTTDDDKTKDLQKLKELRDAEGAEELDGTASANSNQIKTDVVSHADEENIPADDVLDHKIAEATTNGEIAEATEPKASSSEPKTTSRRARKTVPTEATTTKSKSLTHHLLNDNLDDVDDDDDEEDEDDFELGGSDDESSEEENDDEDVEDTEEEEGDDDDEEEESDPSNPARIKKLMRKSIMAILNRGAKKNKSGGDNEEEAKENQDDDEQDDEEADEDDEEDDEDEGDLSKMLDMGSDPGSSSGCTAVVTLLRDRQLFVANAGDSRCVVCRGTRAIEMSIDHKPEDPEERTRIEKAGYKVTLDGRVSGGLNLSRAIGDHAYKKTNSLPAEEQAITALPDIRTLALEDQDEFMVIACDGIWNFMSSQDVVDFVRLRLNKKSLSAICEELFTHCLAPNTSGDGTGCDNMTAIIVKFNFNSQSNQSVLAKPVEQSPWPTMFSSTNNKRALSPEHRSTNETPDNNNSSKKLKIVSENGTNQETASTENVSLNPSTNNVNISNDDQQV